MRDLHLRRRAEIHQDLGLTAVLTLAVRLVHDFPQSNTRPVLTNRLKSHIVAGQGLDQIALKGNSTIGGLRTISLFFLNSTLRFSTATIRALHLLNHLSDAS